MSPRRTTADPASRPRRATLSVARVEAEVEDDIPFPHAVAEPAPAGTGPIAILRRQITGTNVVDEWGLDHDAVLVADALSHLRWSISVGGAHHLPRAGAALVVANHRPLAVTTAVACLAVHRATARVLRPIGIPDVPLAGPFLRRLGGGIGRPEEIAGLLRAGELPAVWARAEWRVSGRVGRVPEHLVAPAIAAKVPVIPLAVLAQPWSRTVRVEVGPPVRSNHRIGPLGAAELADEARRAIQRLVDEATPPSWPLPG